VFDFVAGKLDWMAFGLPVETEPEVILVAKRLTRNWPVCRLADRVMDAKQRAEAGGVSFCPVLNEEGIVLGVVQEEHWKAPPSTSVEEIMDPAPATLRPSYSVQDANEVLKNYYKQEAALVTSSDGKMMGVFKGGETSKG
jgi:predicted transcriptional regulator